MSDKSATITFYNKPNLESTIQRLIELLSHKSDEEIDNIVDEIRERIKNPPCGPQGFTIQFEYTSFEYPDDDEDIFDDYLED